MHDEAMKFVEANAHQVLAGWSVIEIGSQDVNGAIRSQFAHAGSYLGIDIREGAGVDLVADACRWTPVKPVDAVLCFEVLEHCPEASLLVYNVRRWLRPGGLLLLTCAGPGRGPHSWKGGPLEPGESYNGISPVLLMEWMREWWNPVQVTEAGHDVQAIGWRMR